MDFKKISIAVMIIGFIGCGDLPVSSSAPTVSNNTPSTSTIPNKPQPSPTVSNNTPQASPTIPNNTPQPSPIASDEPLLTNTFLETKTYSCINNAGNNKTFIFDLNNNTWNLTYENYNLKENGFVKLAISSQDASTKTYTLFTQVEGKKKIPYIRLNKNDSIFIIENLINGSVDVLTCK